MFLWLVNTIASQAVAGLAWLFLPASDDRSSAALFVGIALGMSVLTLCLWRLFSVTVDSQGIQLRSLNHQMAIGWKDITGVEAHRLSGRVVLREPVRAGLFMRQKMAFAVQDPKWHCRATSKAILARAFPPAQPESGLAR
jgi:hypothetical protein